MVEVVQVVVVVRVVVDRPTVAGMATTTTVHTSTNLALIPTSGLICLTTAQARITSGGEVVATAAMVVVGGMEAIDKVKFINDKRSGFRGCHHSHYSIKRWHLRNYQTCQRTNSSSHPNHSR
jgi:hypothetical protein